MRVTKFSDYALRVLIYLACIPKNELATIAEIAKAYSISVNHVRMVVYKLSQLGFVTSVQGKGGGLELAVNPAEVTLADVVRETEKDFYIVECFNPEGNCPIVSACKLQHILAEALDAFIGVLEQYTLADVLTNKRMLMKLIQLA